MATVLDIARGYVAAGLSVIRVTTDGKKAAVGSDWRTYSDRRPTEQELHRWFRAGGYGIGVPGGPASGNLAVLDFETWAVYEAWLRSLPGAAQQLTRPCPLARTGGGGAHLYVRLAEPVKGVALAHHLVDDKPEILIEVRGNGQMVVAPGSPAKCHPTGNLYEWMRDGWLDPAVRADPLDLHDWFDWLIAAEALNEVVRPRDEVRPDTRNRREGGSKRPGDDFNARGTWEETGLFDAGWHWHRSFGDDRGFVTRPGKSDGVSGSLGMVVARDGGHELFYCFTSSGGPFGHQQSYSRFRVYAMLKHGGDYTTAARVLGRQGYGEQRGSQRAHPAPARPLPPAPSGDPPPAEGEPEDGEPAGPNPPPANGARPPLPVVYYDEIRPALDAADFVEGLLIDGAMSVVYGESGCGKTFFVLDLALHVAAGVPWRGREVDRKGVLYLALEGSHGICNRVSAFKLDQLAGAAELPFAVVPVAVSLLGPESDTLRVVEAAREAAARLSVPVGLVVVDTLSRAMAGGNENAPEDMTAFVQQIDLIRQALPAHVAVVHHSGKDTAKGARGHSSLRAATDTEIEVSRDFGSKVSVAKVTKQRELEIGDEFPFRLVPVELGVNRRGKPVGSCVVRPADEGTAVPARDEQERKERVRKQRAADERAVLLVIDAEAQKGFPGATLSWIGDHVDFSDSRARSAVERLVESGAVVRVKFNRPTSNNAAREVEGYGRPKDEQAAA